MPDAPIQIIRLSHSCPRCGHIWECSLPSCTLNVIELCDACVYADDDHDEYYDGEDYDSGVDNSAKARREQRTTNDGVRNARDRRSNLL